MKGVFAWIFRRGEKNLSSLLALGILLIVMNLLPSPLFRNLSLSFIVYFAGFFFIFYLLDRFLKFLLGKHNPEIGFGLTLVICFIVATINTIISMNIE
ncbi:hypothetical protein WQ54_28765 [Bacillus sp. SA1-12]|nr:hypothetical protein WQ54_28765 [Bacillus sp. SA1-12]